MADQTGQYYSEGIVYKETSLFNTAVFDTGSLLFEVLRIQNATALFLEDHIHRLQDSVKLSGYTYTISVPVIHYLLRNLIKKNNVSNGNIKVAIHFTTEQEPVLYTYFIVHSYPVQSMYINGVESDFFKAERTNPNIKKWNPQIIQRASTFIKTENLYDALLVSDDENITEGSKTNIFFVREDALYTAPGDKVLKGVTREKVIQLCRELHFTVEEQTIPIKKLQDFEAAFFTGTSPKILPICRIANIDFDVTNQLMRRLMQAYDDLITTYIYRW